MFLGTLLFGVTALDSALNCAKENHDMKKETSRLDQNGNLTYSDRLGRRYVNNEMVYETVKYDKYGNRHCYTVGCDSGRVYNDEFEQFLARQRKDDERRKQWAIENGYIGYPKYHPQAKKQWLAEVSTDKFVSSVFGCDGVYRKFYTFDKNYTTSAPGDYGVIISKEEYDGLKRCMAYRASVPAVGLELDIQRMKRRQAEQEKKKNKREVLPW